MANYGITSSSSLLYNPSYPDTSSIVGYPVSSIMPSYTTTVITSAVTLTSFVTVTSGQYLTSTLTPSASNLPLAILEAIEGLRDCSQTIVFTSLAESTCNPTDFNCIYSQLIALGVTGQVDAACSDEDTAQYVDFQTNVCRNVQPVYPINTPSSSSSSTSAETSTIIVTSAPSETPVTTPTPSETPVTTPEAPVLNVTSTTAVPNENSTSTKLTSVTVVPPTVTLLERSRLFSRVRRLLGTEV